MGRNSVHTDGMANEICARLAEGESLNGICKDEHMPPESTVRTWVLDNREGFAANYARAREIGYLKMADEIIEIADGVDPKSDRDRLRVEARKWIVSKVLPKVYGDKVENAHTFSFSAEFETFIRSLNERPEPKVIDGTVATESDRVVAFPKPIR